MHLVDSGSDTDLGTWPLWFSACRGHHQILEVPHWFSTFWVLCHLSAVMLVLFQAFNEASTSSLNVISCMETSLCLHCFKLGFLRFPKFCCSCPLMMVLASAFAIHLMSSCILSNRTPCIVMISFSFIHYFLCDWLQKCKFPCITLHIVHIWDSCICGLCLSFCVMFIFLMNMNVVKEYVNMILNTNWPAFASIWFMFYLRIWYLIVLLNLWFSLSSSASRTLVTHSTNIHGNNDYTVVASCVCCLLLSYRSQE